jgi:hypothetical protein
MLKGDDVLLSVFTRSDRLRPNTKISSFSGAESIKSFVDDFDMEQGIVSARVGLSYDSLRLSPCSGDLWNVPQNARTSVAQNKQQVSRTHPTTTNQSHPKPHITTTAHTKQTSQPKKTKHPKPNKAGWLCVPVMHRIASCQHLGIQSVVTCQLIFLHQI